MTTKPPLTAIGAKPLTRGHALLLVLRIHACRAFLRIMRQGPAACSGRLLLILRLTAAKLNVDVPALEKDFYSLSRKLHPDLNAAPVPRSRNGACEQSSLLNDAYRTLRDPIKRTQYLLELEGVELEEQSKSATEQARATGEVKKQIVPPDLLEEVFELNMQLEELRMNKKMGEDDPSLTADIEKHKVALEEKYEICSQGA